jgi:hypothetical protein
MYVEDLFAEDVSMWCTMPNLLPNRHFEAIYTCNGYTVLDVRDNKKRTMPIHEA